MESDFPLLQVKPASESSNLRRRKRLPPVNENEGINEPDPVPLLSTNSTCSVVLEETDDVEHDKIVDQQLQRDEVSPKSLSRSAAMVILWWILHIAACGVYIAGLILQSELHSSIECSMTYSQRQLIPIPMTPGILSPDLHQKEHPKYGLYKFVDQRDPRPHHQKMLKEWLHAVQETGGENYRQATEAYLREQQLQRNEGGPAVDDHYCAASTQTNNLTSDTVAVLYVPGHWGSYMQSRSIGAHGIQLTGARDHRRAEQVIKALRSSSSASTKGVSSQQQAWMGRSALDESHFVFDVYSVDFQEEGGAWHAQILWAQAAYTARAILQLVKSCRLSQVIILGHSIGGYVSRLVPILYPETRPYIRSIVTLGSPHAYPVFGFDATLHELHRTYLAPSISPTISTSKGVEEDKHQHVLVAVSGGLRDEMIPPVACSTQNIPNSLSILSPSIMQSAGGPDSVKPQLGMDHRAIVWCNNLLSVIRGVIFTLIHDDEQNNDLSSVERLNRVKAYLGLTDADESSNISSGGELPNTNYASSLEEHQTRFSQRYGLSSVIALECAMLYHLEVLVGLFTVLGCLKSADFGSLMSTKWFVLEGIVMILALYLATNTTYDVHLLTLIALLLVANFVLELLQLMFGVIIPRVLFPASLDTSDQFYRIRYFAVGLFLFLLGLQCVGKLFEWYSRLCMSLFFAVYMTTINTTMVVASKAMDNDGFSLMIPSTRTPRQGSRLLTFTSTFSLVAPSLVAGKLVALLSATSLKSLGSKTIPVNLLPSTGLGTTTIRLLLPLSLRLMWVHYQQKLPSVGTVTKSKRVGGMGELLRACLFGFVILYLGPSVFQMGQSFRSGELIAAVSWIECLCLPFAP